MPTFSFSYSIPYIILFLLIYINTIPLYITKTTTNFNYNYSIWLQHFFIAIILIIFFGFRGFLWTDWPYYYPAYNSTPSLFDDLKSISNFFSTPWENGFLFYMILCKTISSNYFFFQFISFIIDFILLYYFFKRIIPKYIILGFLFYILFSGFFFSYSLLRNAKAMMFFLISLKSVEEKKIIKYMLLNFIGALFHITSILYLPLYFILNKKISRKILLTIFIIGNLLFLFQIEWCKIFLIKISYFFPGRLGNLLKFYLSSNIYSNTYGITIGFFERFFSFIIFFNFTQKLYKINKNNTIYLNVFYLYVFIFLYFSEISILLERVAILFVFPYWILYPQLYSLLNIKFKQIFLLILLVYGILKLGIGNRNIFSLYDNVLFSYKSYQERLEIINKHEKIIFNK
jgi:hypothetical protein